jgi:hypothetical protein
MNIYIHMYALLSYSYRRKLVFFFYSLKSLNIKRLPFDANEILPILF